MFDESFRLRGDQTGEEGQGNSIGIASRAEEAELWARCVGCEEGELRVAREEAGACCAVGFRQGRTERARWRFYSG